MKKVIALALALLPAAASAEVELQRLSWQARNPTVTRFADVQAFRFGPQPWKAKLRGSVVLINRGAQAEEGILLRYAVTARVVPSSGGEPVWAVPFMLQERRVPKVGPNESKDIPLTTTPELEAYLKKLSLAGLQPESLKLQVMVEPYRGAGTSVKTIERVLTVTR